MRPRLLHPALLVTALGLCACVERTLTIVTIPDAAEVYVDGVHVGDSPLTLPFTYYGTREVVVRKPGFRVQRHLETMEPPHFQRFPYDIYYELLTSNVYVDARTWSYVLEPTDEAELSREHVQQMMDEARDLRDR